MMILGIVLCVIGFSLRIKSILDMKTFNLALEVPEKINTNGLYKFIRHPSYTGSIIFLFGLSLLSVHLALLYLTVIFFLARTIEEEKLLKSNKKYSEYKKKTGMFIPKFWRIYG